MQAETAEHTLVNGLLDTEKKAQDQLADLKNKAKPITEYADSNHLPAYPSYPDNTAFDDLHTPFHNALNDFAETIDSLVRLDTQGNRGLNEISFNAKYPAVEAAA